MTQPMNLRAKPCRPRTQRQALHRIGNGIGTAMRCPAMHAHPRHAQSGYMTILVSAIVGVIAVMVMSFATLAVNKASFGAEERMARNVKDALADLQVWYQNQADTLAVAGVTPTEAQLQTVLSRTRSYPGMRLAMSTSMASPGCTAGTIACVPWRKIAAWYPATQAPSTSTVQDGLPISEFTGDAIWRVYSSQSWYFERYVQSQAKLNDAARALMSWFAGRKSSNPVLGADANFWRSSDCAQTEFNLPCVDAYNSISTTGVAALLGLSVADVTAPLGGVIEFSNLQDSSTAAPFSVALRVVLPWGGQIRQTVLQP
jgi:type II secretory pathway pseudopilin PulG